MQKKYIIGLDLGTTALKIAIFDQTGELQGVSTKEYQLMTPAVNFVEAVSYTHLDVDKRQEYCHRIA